MYPCGSLTDPAGWELQNMLDVAKIMIHDGPQHARNLAASTYAQIFLILTKKNWRKHVCFQETQQYLSAG